MADDDNDIITNIKIGGADDAKKDLSSVGDTGAEAFKKIGAAADAAAESVQRAIAAASKREGIRPEEFTRSGAEPKDRDSRAPPNLEQLALGETNEEVG
jgi:hypothetical protein